jgi:hypothetical protein
MLILIAMGAGLFWYGRRVRLRAMFPGGQRWPMLQTLRSMPRWDQDRVMYSLGGGAIEFCGIVILLSLTPFF